MHPRWNLLPLGQLIGQPVLETLSEIIEAKECSLNQ